MQMILGKLNQALTPALMSALSPHLIKSMIECMADLHADNLEQDSLYDRELAIGKVIDGMIEMLSVYQAKGNTLTPKNINACLQAAFNCMMKFYYCDLPSSKLIEVLTRNFKFSQHNSIQRELDFYSAISFDIPLRGGAQDAPVLKKNHLPLSNPYTIKLWILLRV